MSLSSNPAPTASGVNRLMTMPCGTYTNPRRGLCFTLLANAGTIASSNGSATVAPSPRRNVRRPRCFWVMNIVACLREISFASVRAFDRGSGRRRRGGVLCNLQAERGAVRDPEHDGREAVVVLRSVAHDRAHVR